MTDGILAPAQLAQSNAAAWAKFEADPTGALEGARRTLAAARDLGDDLETIRALRTMGAAAIELGRVDEARGFLTEASLVVDDDGGPAWAAEERGEVYRLLARASFMKQDYETALRNAHAALDMADSHRSGRLKARALNDAGIVLAHMGSFQQGLDYLLMSLRMLEEEGIAPEGGPLNNVGNIYMLQEKPARALEYFVQGHGRFREVGSRRGQVIALGNIGRALEAMEQPEAALERHELALGLARELGDPTYLPAALTKYGAVLGKLGRSEEAFASFEEAMGYYAERQGAFKDELLMAAAQLHLKLGDPQAAEPLLREALELSRETGSRQTEAAVNRELSRSLQEQGRAQEALEWFQLYHELDREQTKELYSSQTQALLLQHEVEQSRREGRLLQDLNERLTTAYEELQDLHQALENKNEELERLSMEDPLTQLHNRRHLEQRMTEELLRLERTGGTFGVVMCDIDNFKAINDAFSHAVGDRILVKFGELLRACTRRSDVVARVGGEEFVLILPDTPLQDTMNVAEKVRRAVEAYPWHELQPGLGVTMSAGVSEAHASERPTNILAKADMGLYRAKDKGRNVVYPIVGEQEDVTASGGI